MKRLFSTLLFASLLLSTPAFFAQESPAPEASSDTAATPADKVVRLFPPRALKNLRKQKEEDIRPCGLLSTGKAVLVFSHLGSYKGGSYQDLVVSSSKDGSSWDKLAIAIPKIAPTGCQANVAAVYDSITHQVVVLSCVTPYATLASASSTKKQKTATPTAPRFYVSFGKGGKFSKPKDVSKQFAGRRNEPGFGISGHGLFFQGICLTRGEHRGRLLFLACHQEKTVCSIYSDDHGRSWKLGASITVPGISPGTLGDAPFLFEAEDGTIVSHTRDLRDGAWLSSDDGGVNWVEVKPAQPGASPAHFPNAYMVLNSKDGKGTDSRLLAISLLGNHQKNCFHVALSYDWGRTWPHEKTVYCAPLNTGGHINIHPLAPGTLGVITSSKGGFAPTSCTEDAGFTTFTLSWLTDGKDDGIDEEEPPAEGEASPQ